MQLRGCVHRVWVVVALASGCASNPDYLPSPTNLEAGIGMITEGSYRLGRSSHA